MYTTKHFPLLVGLFSICVRVCAISEVFCSIYMYAFACVCICTFVLYYFYSSFCLCIVCVCVSRPCGRMQRAEPWQLRQENSDSVWNELAYLKNLTRKLSIEK